MVLENKHVNAVLLHLNNYQQDRMWIEERTEEIAEGADYSKSLAKTNNVTFADPTASKAQRLEAELEQVKKWTSVVEATWEKFKDMQHSELMTLLFEKKHSVEKICMELHIERRNYYRWRRDIIYFAALKACEFGLMSV